MLRVELFVLLGFVPGILVGIFGSHFVRKYFAWRDSRVKQTLVKARVDEALDVAPTSELLEELSTRDLSETFDSKKEKRNA